LILASTIATLPSQVKQQPNPKPKSNERTVHVTPPKEYQNTQFNKSLHSASHCLLIARVSALRWMLKSRNLQQIGISHVMYANHQNLV
jgi:hypothetical protein